MSKSSAEDGHERSQPQEFHRNINMTKMLAAAMGVYVHIMRRDSSPPPLPPPPNDFFSVAHEPSSIQDMSSTSRTSTQVGVMFYRLYKKVVE
jgi:hypothetical protein